MTRNDDRIAVLATSRKEDERRLPIHPDHLGRIPGEIRSRLFLEEGYGDRFGTPDRDLRGVVGGFGTRSELLGTSRIVVLPKPLAEDLRAMEEGSVLWGWPHCVQQAEITQAAIDRRLTLIAWESMYGWSRAGRRGPHVFARNNELAGYCGVLHALEILGIDGGYGPSSRAAILGFGSVSRGAIHALRGRGFDDVTVLTQRPPHLVASRIPGCRHLQMRDGKQGIVVHDDDRGEIPILEVLESMHVLVNGTLQDPEHPLMFLREGEAERLPRGALIVDASCDRGMGFPFARPTGFESPTVPVGHVTYYAVDHSPSYLWRAATWEISTALLPYLPTVAGGPDSWAADPVVDRAVEIRDGVVENETILSFQGREPDYPHRRST